MATDIFEFWSIPVKMGPHPADREVLGRVKHHFDLTCLPRAFTGSLKSAPVILLYLSLGLSDQDGEAKTKKGQARYRRTWGGEEPLWGPDDHKRAWEWWSQRTACFGKWEDLTTKVAVLNICPYHSKTFKDKPLLAALPSCRVALDWAQNVLFPEATAGKRVVVCLRSAGFWGLREAETPFGKALFAPPVVRNGHMKLGDTRDKVIKSVRSMI